MKLTAKNLLEIAAGEIGYCEKETNSQLDDKSANAGDANYTKYARDLRAAGYYNGNKQGFAWCDMFVDWCFYKLAGNAQKAQELICQTGDCGAGCKYSAQYYKAQNRYYTNSPQPGDQIFFGRGDDYEHTGIVEKVVGTTVHTIEGNTSNQVARRTYALTSECIKGYGRPKFETESETVTTPVTGTISTGSDADEKTIWDFFAGKGLNHFAIAGIMGNLFAESGLRSNNLQNTYERTLGYTDATYTEAVDNGSYGNFVKDAAGYGLAQWTYWSRKQSLWDAAKAAKKSIGDLLMQLDFLWQELQGYSSVMKTLKAATSVREASDVFMVKFEAPADQSEKAKANRAKYGQTYYDKYAGETVEAEKPVVTVTGLKVGDIVDFTGCKHYVSSNAASAKTCKPGKAKVTSINKGGKHPYHLVRVAGGGSSVYGWVDAADIGAQETVEDAAWTPAVGDAVIYNGSTHYVSSNAAKAKTCKPGKAKITSINKGGKHPYHLVRVIGGGSTVYGWVDAGTFTKG